MDVLIRTEDGSFIQNGRVLYFSYDRFVRDIAQGNCCFICGASPESVPFNDEHILPNWILRRYKLHDKTITLPNGAKCQYGKFKIPCCESCNTKLGERLEKPIREMFDKGFDGFAEQLQSEGPLVLFCWMCLIFLKTHLKDANLPMHLDRRKGLEKIGELHSWSELHHAHCIARSFYTGATIRREVFGSLQVFPAKNLPHIEPFDYCDISVAQTMLLRIDEIAVIAVFDDSTACNSVIQEFTRIISGPLSPLQLRELATHMAAINIHLAERPKFRSSIDPRNGEYEIGAEVPREIRLEQWRDEILGEVMHRMCGSGLPEFEGRAEVLENIKMGRHTFLRNDKGEFLSQHMDVIDAKEPK